MPSLLEAPPEAPQRSRAVLGLEKPARDEGPRGAPQDGAAGAAWCWGTPRAGPSYCPWRASSRRCSGERSAARSSPNGGADAERPPGSARACRSALYAQGKFDPALNPQAKFVNAKFGPKDYQQSDKARRGGLVVPAGPRRPPPG